MATDGSGSGWIPSTSYSDKSNNDRGREAGPHKNCSVPNLGNSSGCRSCVLPDINSPLPLSRMATPSTPFSPPSPTRNIQRMTSCSTTHYEPSSAAPLEQAGRAESAASYLCEGEGVTNKAGHVLSALEECAEHEEHKWQPIGAGSTQYRHYRVNK